jgi:flagellar biosynthetic protein FlhB
MLGGWIFSTKAIAFNAGKLNPAGRHRPHVLDAVAGRADQGACQVGCWSAWVAWWVVSRDVGDMMALMGAAPASMRCPTPCMIVVKHCAADRGHAGHRRDDRRALPALELLPSKLRMSREDLRQEHKESEGDPHVKAQIRRHAAGRRRAA